MTRKLIKDLSGSVIDNYNTQKKQARKAPKGFAINDSIKITESLNTADMDTASWKEQSESKMTHNNDTSEVSQVSQVNQVSQESILVDSSSAAIIHDAANSESSEINESSEAGQSNNSINQISLETVQELFAKQVASLRDSLSEELAKERELNKNLQSQLTDLESAKNKVETELQSAKKDQVTLKDLEKLIGSPLAPMSEKSGKSANMNMPNVNRITTTKSDTPSGSLKEWFEVREDASRVSKVDARGKQFMSYDNREVNAYAKENRKHLLKDLESWGKANGMLRGSTVVKDAATIKGDVTGGFLDVLSSIMRTNNRPGFVFWQFADTVIDFGKGLGDTVKIPRAAYLPGPVHPDDRLLSSASTYTRIDSGNQSLATNVVTAELKEWGLGRNSQYPPVTLVNFVTAYSMLDLISILNRNLLRDYYLWEDLKIRSLWEPTTRVVYNKKDSVSTTALAATDGGTLTRRFLASLYGYMKELAIPPYMGNKYGLVVNSTALTQLKQSYDTLWHAATPQELQTLTEFLNPALISPGETDRISGYAGDFENFMIFETNNYGIGSGGAPGVLSTTINSVANTLHSSFAFGTNTIGRGIGTEMQIRFDDDTDFGRASRAIWRSEESFVAMDVDPSGYTDNTSVPQQLRVIEVQTLKTAV